jgi:hypothetical protein
MAHPRFRFRRLAVAIGFGLLVEAVSVGGATIISDKIPAPWGDRIANLTQEPAYQFVNWLADVRHPGFEEQAGYAMLIPLLQWVVWSVVIYVLLLRRKRVPADFVEKEISSRSK